MNSSVPENSPLRERFAEVFARLPGQAIEQFYAQYQLWLLRRRVPLLQKQIEALDEHLAENQQVLRSLQPSAIALAVLARLQANGVSAPELLDLLLSRGEDWLDRMMQRLDYCEQVRDFIQGDYTQWCYRSLDGAYDWIDTLLGSAGGDEEPRQASEGESEATEELLLRKLRLDDEDEMLEATLRPAVACRAEDDQSDRPAVHSVPSEPAGQVALADASGEGSALSEQPAELVDWADLDASAERPAPWYGVGLAADPDVPAERSEGDSLLQEEGTLRIATATLNGTDIPDVAEQVEVAEVLPATAEVENSLQDESPLSAADSVQEGSVACALFPAGSEAGEQVGNAAESERESGMQESTEVADLAEYGAVEAADLVFPSTTESRTEPQEVGCDSGGELECSDWQIDGEEKAETLPEVERDTNQADRQGAEGDILPCGEGWEPVEREEAASEQAGGRAYDDQADLQEEQRPWYEYLDLHQPTSAAQPAAGERVEPEAPSLAALDRPLQEEAGWVVGRGGEEQADEATQPMMLTDVQRAREQAERVSGGVHLLIDDGHLPGANARPERETQEEVHVVLSLAVPEASLPEQPERESAEEIQREEAGGSAPSRHGQPAFFWPQDEKAPAKQRFWQRLSDWLQGKRVQP